MARLRSPNYPDIPIQQAIDLIDKLYKSNRTFSMDREVAARELEYSGLTGPASKRIASLIQFGLLEKHAKNEVRVSEMAEAILHPDDSSQREEGLRSAAYKPPLFSELRERFPGGVPSEGNLRSYLLKRGFSDRGVQRAIKSYLGTCEHVERLTAYESHGQGCPDHPESVKDQQIEEDWTMEAVEPRPFVREGARSSQHKALNLNAMNVGVSGGLVRINVVLDSSGLDKLERKIAALRTLVADEDDERPADNGADHTGESDAQTKITE